MHYYQSNAVYQKLDNTKDHFFMWVTGNAWTLIYGDRDSSPIVVALVAGRSWTPQLEIKGLVKRISVVAGLPWVEIYFDDTVKEIDFVDFAVGGAPLKRISLPDLKAALRDLGLPTSSGATLKALNDASSSAYHNWQRANLGAITVSDIDLFRRKTELVPAEFVELKRSYISLDKWTPYRQDFPNFQLIHSVSRSCGIPMTIAYNVRQKSPFRDDADTLSLFSFNGTDAPKHIGKFAFSEFVSGAHLK
ncbi:hypothetical protein [Alterinioella nitratireducens]|uniref:hypothetical protein n=1 Tax=Alterinioella nitratireducens TaxID=2735915 RepID=UPI001557C1F9|nr:hypothetical protein [Alterinioella nitratireducens]NPD21417.1 hypothetical protein [Alterinioella nitratireducens]